MGAPTRLDVRARGRAAPAAAAADDAAAMIAQALAGSAGRRGRTAVGAGRPRNSPMPNARCCFRSSAAVGVAGVTPYHQERAQRSLLGGRLQRHRADLNGSLYLGAPRRGGVPGAGRQTRCCAISRISVSARRHPRVARTRTAYQRVDLTNQLVAQARDALDLAQPRYDLGLSSIVELTQAQLNKTQAEIEQASVRYEYQARTSALRYQTGVLK